jgi:hypothetical protein
VEAPEGEVSGPLIPGFPIMRGVMMGECSLDGEGIGEMLLRAGFNSFQVTEKKVTAEMLFHDPSDYDEKFRMRIQNLADDFPLFWGIRHFFFLWVPDVPALRVTIHLKNKRKRVIHPKKERMTICPSR